MFIHRQHHSPGIARRGFTIIELLSAISIMLVLMAFAVPAVTSLARGRNVDYASTVISGCLEQARMTALAQKTYVWVGFAEALEEGSQGLAVAVFASNDGTRNRLPSNLRLLRPIAILKQVVAATGLDEFGGRPMTLPDGRDVYDLPLTTSNLVSWSNSPVGTLQFACALVFAPDGSLIADNQLRRLSEFGIALATDTARNNAVAFQIEGLTGRSHVYRQ